MLSWITKKLLILMVQKNQGTEAAMILAEAFEEGLPHRGIGTRRGLFMRAVNTAKDTLWW